MNEIFGCSSKFYYFPSQKEPKRVKNHLFSFARPFSSEIWVFVAFSYVCVSLTMWMVARFSPFEWELSSPSKVQELTDCECNAQKVRYDDHECCADDDHQIITSKAIEKICVHGSNKNFNQFEFNVALCNDDNCLHNKFNAETDYFNSHMYRNSYYMKNFHDEGHGGDLDDLMSMGMLSDEQHSMTITPRSRDILFEGEAAAAADDDMSISSNEIELTTFHNDFTFNNSFWYMIGTLMQGSDLHPKVSFHYFFSLAA